MCYTEKAIEQKLYQEAAELLKSRYPRGWGGAAAVYTDKGQIFTSVALETANGGAQLCIETGALCEAHKYNAKVTHCICLTRDDENSPLKILSPCGICQERLRYWGEDVMVGVTAQTDEIMFVSLKTLQPYHWTGAYPKDELEHYIETQ